ncbi:MAG: succinylglutamate desuccinylase/aspartoacylase family protein [Saprospiraceae bacterium]|nr:succinylglutamate desuccinylase/aspartoacylase family protein [Bacteroidia bacterium]NNE16566.1 succinylglutamate desuccinylase/aspartoacylase family protein [Saprospiraceae bacterium]NNL93761.1 succinylglutamate desuccinylase/aspartoacylase family protein [Saprospiraceae bacterium]
MFTTNDQIPHITEFNISDIPVGTIKHFWLNIVSDGFGSPISIPLMVARGVEKGPVLGLTAAVHGNELNGIPVIQRLFNEIDVKELRGTIIGVPVVNVPSFMRKQRRFNDGVDLNHIMPGKADGNLSQIYAYRFIERLVKHFDFLIDLHTASFGRINSYYVRADMGQEATKILAQLQNADIIVHNPPSDGTLRGAADELGIPAITLEVGNPSIFQKRLIRSGIEGIHNALCHLKMIDDEIELSEKETVLCKKSYWIYTDRGGLLTIHVELRDMVKKGQKIATIRNIFGAQLNEFFAPEDGIVIGKSISPVNQSGGRILHLGIL